MSRVDELQISLPVHRQHVRLNRTCHYSDPRAYVICRSLKSIHYIIRRNEKLKGLDTDGKRDFVGSKLTSSIKITVQVLWAFYPRSIDGKKKKKTKTVINSQPTTVVSRRTSFVGPFETMARGW